eukprot:200625-Rhodomonas_salina.1
MPLRSPCAVSGTDIAYASSAPRAIPRATSVPVPKNLSSRRYPSTDAGILRYQKGGRAYAIRAREYLARSRGTVRLRLFA